ncbi:hypothetical protein DSO57_1024643 [Entomophthora muscae]|uniref:Uncharacterized protein n=1 Tax=Entomophthora muscae TaxID=34485 RepID=A0ACC2SRT7_9FUNG|nr:hypothetical protein DSO57_1024643 [Entomophthora muscae]
MSSLSRSLHRIDLPTASALLTGLQVIVSLAFVFAQERFTFFSDFSTACNLTTCLLSILLGGYSVCSYLVKGYPWVANPLRFLLLKLIADPVISISQFSLASVAYIQDCHHEALSCPAMRTAMFALYILSILSYVVDVLNYLHVYSQLRISSRLKPPHLKG